MKRIIHLIGYITIIFVIYSCNSLDNKKFSQDYKKDTTIIVPDTLKQKIIAQDSLMSELLNKIDTLTITFNHIRQENIILKKKVEDFKSPKNPWSGMSIGALGLSIIAIIVSLLIWNSNKNRLKKITSSKMASSKEIKKLQNEISVMKSNFNQLINNSITNKSNITNLNTRLSQLELKKNQNHISMESSPSIQNTTSLNIINKSEYPKTGYAMIDADIYFTNIYVSNQEGCVFKINFTCPTRGNFNIISLDKIQSRNDWQKKIECSGISINDASDFRVEDEGICEKLDENVWQVIKPLKIKLLK